MCLQGTQEDKKRRVDNAGIGIRQEENELKAMRLMLRKHLINLIEVVTDGELFESMQRTRPE
jgi:hypothetical protein